MTYCLKDFERTEYPSPNLVRRFSSPQAPLELVDLFTTNNVHLIDLKFWELLEKG